MNLQLEYGRSGLEINLPADRVVASLSYQQASPLAQPETSLRDLLDNPQGSPPLVELARDRRTACILICDITRPVPNEMILGPVLESLHRAGLEREPVRRDEHPVAELCDAHVAGRKRRRAPERPPGLYPPERYGAARSAF